MRVLSIILALSLSLQAQDLLQVLAAPIDLELGLQPAHQSNPLNLSEIERDRAARGYGNLGEIDYAESNVLSAFFSLDYDPRIFKGRKTAFDVNATIHQHQQIPERDYGFLSMSIRQSLGSWRFLEIGHSYLPSLYLRDYYFPGQGDWVAGRYACVFGTTRSWLEYQHRLAEGLSLEYRATQRVERYGAPFSHYDMIMAEVAMGVRFKPLRAVSTRLEFQYGQAENQNEFDDIDRSYQYLNIRPSITLPVPGEWIRNVSIQGRFDQRAYESDSATDPLHAGRYQYEYRLDLRLNPRDVGRVGWSPYFGYRQRVVESESQYVEDLKSFSRWWLGIRVSFRTTFDIYL